MSEELKTYESEGMVQGTMEITLSEAAIQRTAEMLPEMDRRYSQLHAILQRLSAGDDVDWWRIDLARRDLLAAIGVMNGEDTDD